MASPDAEPPRRTRFAGLFGKGADPDETAPDAGTGTRPSPPKWSMGVLNDSRTIEVPGSVLLLASHKNQPLGLRQAPARTSQSSIPTGFFESSQSGAAEPRRPYSRETPPPEDEKKKTSDGKIILEPQPEDSHNDPLNWPTWRRDSALMSLGFYCMVGGGITPLLAAGFYNVADDYGVDVEDVSLTTGLYMLGMGLGSVIASPTAILYGKRPVYLCSAVLFIAASIWCAVSPTFGSLVAARVFQGMAISPVECLPSATIAEIFFLHERAYRIGIYTLLLLGGKNLVPLISAAVIQSLGWRWVFWIVTFVVAFGLVMLFFFVPETFWDRSPSPRVRSRRPSFLRRLSSRHGQEHRLHEGDGAEHPASEASAAHPHKSLHVGFAPDTDEGNTEKSMPSNAAPTSATDANAQVNDDRDETGKKHISLPQGDAATAQPESSSEKAAYSGTTPGASPAPATPRDSSRTPSVYSTTAGGHPRHLDPEKARPSPADFSHGKAYTQRFRHQPPKSFLQQLKVWNGRLYNGSWFKVMLRPFILFAYPAVLWSTVVYSCSVGWLIVISNTMSMIYRTPERYNFNALQTGLVYLSPFVGGVLGTAVAGKISDVVVKALARRNGGLYEPEFRLVMAAPILVTTVIGLIGFGWSAEEGAHYMVPTVFFGIVSFGCSLGSTTSITFCVDSYRQYAGEALVTLNFSKNVLHGLVFSLFVTHWMAADGPKNMYMWLGIIQLILCLFSIPMYIYGKRARMWTVRKNLMEKF